MEFVTRNSVTGEGQWEVELPNGVSVRVESFDADADVRSRRVAERIHELGEELVT